MTQKVQKLIGLRLLLGILLISSLATAVFTGISFYLDYKIERSALEDQLKMVSRVSLKNITRAATELDEGLLVTYVQGVLNQRDIHRVDLKLNNQLSSITMVKGSENIESLGVTGFLLSDAFFKQTWEIPSTSNSRESSLGTLTVTVSEAQMFSKLWNKAIYFFASQGVKTLIVSMLIMILVKKLVTGHLEDLFEFWQSQDLSSTSAPKPLHLHKKDLHDELDILAEISNQVFTKLGEYNRAHQHEMDSEREKAKLAANLASLGEMAGGIAHEINSPLLVISGYNEIIENYLSNIHDGESQKYIRFTKSIQQSLDRISNITYGLLAYSRDGSKDTLAEASLQKVLGDVLALSKIKIKKMDIDIELLVDLPDDPLMIRCKEVQIGQVFINLMNNAIDAIASKTMSEKWIRVACSRLEQNVLVRIENSGDPISEDIAEKIFDPFFTTKDVGKGTGLGLSICLGYVKDHNGTLSLDRSVAHPAFEVLLPISEEVLQVS